MELDPSIHIVMHSVLSLKIGCDSSDPYCNCHRHHRLQWEDTIEKGQHNLLCENNIKSSVSYSNVASICLLFGLIT
jgi:hypothetical protein